MPSCATAPTIRRPADSAPVGWPRQRPESSAGASLARGRSGRDGHVRLRVGKGKHHPRKGDAVGDAVVDAEQQRTALAEALDQIDVPERPGGIERRRDEVAHQLLEGRAVARGW